MFRLKLGCEIRPRRFVVLLVIGGSFRAYYVRKMKPDLLQSSIPLTRCPGLLYFVQKTRFQFSTLSELYPRFFLVLILGIRVIFFSVVKKKGFTARTNYDLPWYVSTDRSST